MSELVQVEAPKPGRWYKGMPSPNRGGRPRGITDRKAKLAQRIMDDADGVVRVMIEKALEGDASAASLILSRVLPALRSQNEKVQFDFDPTASISSQVEAVLAAVASGAVAADVGKQIIDAIGTLSNVRMAEELDQRITMLEAKALPA